MKLTPYHLFLHKKYRSVDVYYNECKNYDVFISGYSDETMVRKVYDRTKASEKIWLIFPDYILINEPEEEKFILEAIEVDNEYLESIFINSFYEHYQLDEKIDKNICIDITGFIKPYVFYLIYLLKEKGFSKVDVVYSEPKFYKDKEKTKFSSQILSVRAINYLRKINPDTSNDVLLVNAGYDVALITGVMEQYSSVRQKKLLIGSPPLMPDMLQENVLSIESLKNDVHNFSPIFAPANDPFETAHIVSEYIQQELEKKPITNLYIAPLATKPQALGLTLFLLAEKNKLWQENNLQMRIVYPFTESYSSSAGKEISRINVYTLEYRLLDFFN